MDNPWTLVQCTHEFYGKTIDFSMYMGKPIKYLFDKYSMTPIYLTLIQKLVIDYNSENIIFSFILLYVCFRLGLSTKIQFLINLIFSARPNWNR